MKTKTNAEILQSLKKANKVRRELMAQRAGFKTADAYVVFLKGAASKDAGTSRCFESKSKPTVHIVTVLDRSGSMGGSKFNNALAGIKSEVAELKLAKDINYTASLITFSGWNTIDTVYYNQPVKDVVVPDLRVHDLTALNDAVGKTLTRLLRDTKNEKVIVSIFTDGAENNSKVFNSREVSDLVEKCQAKGMTVTFIGTEQDVAKVVKDFKIDKSNTLSHQNTGASVQASFNLRMEATRGYSSKLMAGASEEELSKGFYQKKQGKL